jgi:gamma-glutamyltranspeptidase/glutathione hydrolase
LTTRAVVTPHLLSAQAGRDVLLAGGNAVDAAIAAVAAQGVVAPETCGVGGDLFALIHAPGWDRPLTLNSSGRAGSAVSAEALRTAGHGSIPRDAREVVTIPGCVDGLETLSREWGRLPLKDSLAPAIALASEGFPVSAEQSSAFTRRADEYRDHPAVAEFYPEGRTVQPGETVVRPALAATLRTIAEGGRDAFYMGEPGEDIIQAVGGLILREDMERSQAEWVEPVGIDVGGLTAWTIPPNSQGYLGPGTLAVFESLDPPDDPEDPLWWHLLIESYRCLAWERDDLVADPDRIALPAELFLDRTRIERAAASVDPDRAGVWPDRIGALSGTAYMNAADGEGMGVSIIQSNYNGTGSAYGAARSGFLLQDRGLGFTLTSGHPNELAPGRRPLHTLSPTLWTEGDQPRWLLGTRGGAVQPQLVAQVGARAILGGHDLEQAQGAPRWTVTDFGPGSTSSPVLEPGIDPGVIDGLRARGHQLAQVESRQSGWGPVSIIELDGTRREAAADPRVDTATALVF